MLKQRIFHVENYVVPILALICISALDLQVLLKNPANFNAEHFFPKTTQPVQT